MAIMLIVAALASPMIFQSLHGTTKVNAAADLVRARWADCRAQAIEEGRPYRFSIIPNSGRFRIEPHQAGGAVGNFLNPDAAPGSGDGNQGLIIADSLPEGVRFGT